MLLTTKPSLKPQELYIFTVGESGSQKLTQLAMITEYSRFSLVSVGCFLRTQVLLELKFKVPVCRSAVVIGGGGHRVLLMGNHTD